MWLSERAAVPGTGAFAHIRIGTVTIGGEKPAVLLDGEHRELEIAAPPGLGWSVEPGDQVMVAETDDGERFLLGAVSGGSRTDGQSPVRAYLRLDGKSVTLQGGRSSVTLDDNGVVTVNGMARVNGSLSVNGHLFLNGLEVTVKGEE